MYRHKEQEKGCAHLRRPTTQRYVDTWSDHEAIEMFAGTKHERAGNVLIKNAWVHFLSVAADATVGRKNFEKPEKKTKTPHSEATVMCCCMRTPAWCIEAAVSMWGKSLCTFYKYVRFAALVRVRSICSFPHFSAHVPRLNSHFGHNFAVFTIARH